MILVDQAKKKKKKLRVNKSNRVQLGQTTLASVESLAMPLVHEVVLSADLGCLECQKKVADVISRLNDTESMVVDVLEKKVTLTYRSVKKESTTQVATIKRNPPLKIVKNLLILLSSCR